MCWIFQVSCCSLVEPYQRDRSSEMDGYRDSADLDIIHHPCCARGHSLRHDHHGLQRRTLEDLFASSNAENRFHEGELWHTDIQRHIIQCGKKLCVSTQLWTLQTCMCTYNIHQHVQTHMEMQMLPHMLYGYMCILINYMHCESFLARSGLDSLQIMKHWETQSFGSIDWQKNWKHCSVWVHVVTCLSSTLK